jgi:ABC-type lipoprotein export system ATPase subunit
MQEIILLKNIYKKYKETTTWVLNNINFVVEEKKFIFICGPSGVGKSTLLHILGLMDKPTQGEVWFLNKKVDFNKNNLSELRLNNIGFVFQFHYLLEHLNVKENILLPKWVKDKKNFSNNTDKYIEEYIEFLGIKHLLNRYPYELSGGEQQRVSLARALVNKPKVVIADEPTGNLDQDNALNIVSLMRNFIDKYGTSFVVATHNIQLTKFGDKIVQLKNGEIVI